jgi:hypothetical protein
MRAPSCCSDRSSSRSVSCVLVRVAKMRWFTEEGGLLVVETALQVGHELHGCCLVCFILF